MWQIIEQNIGYSLSNLINNIIKTEHFYFIQILNILSYKTSPENHNKQSYIIFKMINM